MALMNLRNALMAGKRKPTAKDYVQDGLVAMWDGIENAGWGVHNPSATTWKDLTGSGYDFQIPSTGVEVKNDCISKSYGASSLSTSLPETSRQEFSVEIVTNIKNVNSGAGIIWAANPSWRGGFLFYRSSTLQWYYPWERLESLNYSDNIGIIKNWSINWKPSAQNLFCDNSVIASDHRQIDSRNVLSRWFLGEYDSNKSSNADYYSVRLYSRALTADEIARNYNIDKARFGLP